MTMPVTTLRTLCEQHAPDAIDFLKIDVEGAERDVLAGGDWQRFRPRVVLVEALEPLTMAPAWQGWEALLTGNGYRFAFFDNLNRYYVAEEHAALAGRLTAAPDAPERTARFSDFKPARDDPTHPDHRLARLLAGLDAIRLPVLPPGQVVESLTAGLDPARLERAAKAADIAEAHQRLFGAPPTPEWAGSLELGAAATVRDLYCSAVASAPFRAACGRISASSAW
jgi:hypothetical protein